jgi:hypothetical protein
MPLPKLSDWQDTRIALHHAAQVVGGIRKAAVAEEPNWVHLGMTITPDGITTEDLPDLGAFELHFAEGQILHRANAQVKQALSLAGHSQISLADAVDGYLETLGSAVRVDRYKVTSSGPLAVEPALGADYAHALNMIGGALGRVRESLPGEKSRLVVWPHGFDAAFLWFATTEETERAPHMGVGFSPGSDGLPRPYVYIYAAPMPEGLLKVSLPEPARWFQGHWTGMVLDYDAIAGLDDPARSIEDILRRTYQAILPLLNLTLDAR